jgi:hypothetical protein
MGSWILNRLIDFLFIPKGGTFSVTPLYCRPDRRGDRVGAVMKLQIIEAPGQFQQ